MGYLWAYSIWLEAGSILPQLMMISKVGEVENITAHYVFFLGLYRMFYVIHWYVGVNLGFIIGIILFGLRSWQGYCRLFCMETLFTILSRAIRRRER